MPVPMSPIQTTPFYTIILQGGVYKTVWSPEGYKSLRVISLTMGYTVARKVVVEVEVPEGRRLEELLKGVKYRILENRVEKRRRLLDEITGALGEARSGELDEIAAEAWNA